MRIENLENQICYGLPPQLNNGEYAQLVRENLELAFNINSYRDLLARELFDIQIMELKSRLQEQLFDKMMAQPTIDSIMEISPYRNIRETAFDFIENKV